MRLFYAFALALFAGLSVQGDWAVFPGRGPYYPDLDALPISTSPPTFTSTGMLLDAATKKAAIAGRVWFPERSGTKTVTKVHWRFGAVTKTGGSTLKVSLQDVALTGNPPAIPDGVADQSAVVANADANFAADTWYPGATLDSGRPVAYAARLAVVWEYDTYAGSDSVSISTVSGAGSAYYAMESQPVLFGGSAWAVSQGIPIVMLEFSDGSFGTLEGAVVWSAIHAIAFNSSTENPINEYGISYVPPVTHKVDGLWASAAIANLSDPEICLYNAAVEMLPGYPVQILSAAINNNSGRYAFIAIPEATLEQGQKYYLTLRPTSTTNTTIYSFEVADAAHLAVAPGGTSVAEVKRVDGGAFTETPTRRPFLGFRLSAIETSQGGGGPVSAETSITVIQ